MWISRMRVTGGFLADLDVTFGAGLNVVIGPRGAGKTTLLELVRHALGTPHADRTRASREGARVRTMLGDGEVVLDLETDEGSHRLVVDADGGGRRDDIAGLALMLGQNELEAIASDAESRLRLIDLRAQVERNLTGAAEIQALTNQLFSMRTEMTDLEERTRQWPLLQADLEILVAQEATLMEGASAEMTINRERLRELESELLKLLTDERKASAAIGFFAAIEQARRALVGQLEELKVFPLASDQEAAIRPPVTESMQYLSRIGELLDAAQDALQRSRSDRSLRERSVRTDAEPLRSQLNDAERGLGELTNKVRNIRAQLSQLETDQMRVHELRARYVAQHDARAVLLDELEGESERNYLARQLVAQEVSQHLSTRVTIAIEHLADARAFRAFLADALQGSGLKFNSIADAFSKRLLPRQLLTMIETHDSASTAIATQLPQDRIARAIEHLDHPAILTHLASVQLEDMANFLLLDGPVLKNVEELSTGQKCAVTLPILLTEHRRALVLDQPEDHLDNAYLVDNIVVGLNDRSASRVQTIVATHNANIPVLGSASQVILLRSDGRRGYVSRAGSFDSPDIVKAITNLMEGGEDAFRRRAEFYRTHGLLK